MKKTQLKTCEATGKRIYRDEVHAKMAARRFARALIESGRSVRSFYTYRCRHCGHVHLTSHPGNEAKPAFYVAAKWMQEWARPTASPNSHDELDMPAMQGAA